MGGIFCTRKKEKDEPIHIDHVDEKIQNEEINKPKHIEDEQIQIENINKPIRIDKINETTQINEMNETTQIDEINGTTHISALNVDCLVEIFLYLPIDQILEMEEVCVLWKLACEKTYLEIRRLEFDQNYRLNDGSSLSPIFLRRVLVRCGAHLTYLRLEGIDTSRMLRIISNYCSNLTTIYLQFDYMNSDCYIQDARAFSRLRNIKSFTLKDTDKTYSIEFLFFLPRTVESIHLIPYPPTPTLNYTNVFRRFESLDCLEMAFFCLSEDMMESLSYKQTITKLTLSYCNIQEGIHYILNLRNLEYLDLPGGDVYDVLLARFPEHFQKLKYLNLSESKNLSNGGIRELRHLNNLEELYMNHMDEDVTDLFIGLLRGIKKLHCAACRGVRDRGIMQLIENCPDLQELNVKGTSITGETLRFAINVTRNRTNSVILKIIADLDRLNFDVENESHSPFLILEQSWIYS